MTSRQTKIEALAAIFRYQQVMSIEELIAHWPCSVRTMQRRLKSWEIYRSYNANGGYYVFADIPTFDSYGIWRFRDIFFSKHGNLKETVIHLVEQSPAGLSAREMNKILGISSERFLSEHVKTSTNLTRLKDHGRYIYFSQEPEVYKAQQQEREKLTGSLAQQEQPSDMAAVMILAQRIKYPTESIEQLARRVRQKGLQVSVTKVRNLLIYHDLLKKIPRFYSYEFSEVISID